MSAVSSAVRADSASCSEESIPSSEESPDYCTSVNEGNNHEKEVYADIRKIFSGALWVDYVLMLVGTIGAFVSGITIPVINILFGRVFDALNAERISIINGSHVNIYDTMTQMVTELCKALVVLGCISFASGFIQIYAWSIAGERLTQRFRERYVRAVLYQDISWIDSQGPGYLAYIVNQRISQVRIINAVGPAAA